MNSVRSKFFWQGAGEDFKYHMASWESLCRPKDQGGLGIINTQIMNECLLTKWIWKISRGSDDTWYKILEAKYMPDGDFFKSRSKRVLLNFGKGCIRLNTYLNGVPCTK
jgi:hypothetical protein